MGHKKNQQPTTNYKLLAIVGPTASGKTDLAFQIAKLVPAEVITADSRTIYCGMDIGTAKVNRRERQKIPHWGLDLLNPGQLYSVKEFQQYAAQKIEEINARDKVALLVGGTGLYIDSVLYNYNFIAPASKQREKLEKLTIEQLQAQIIDENLPMPNNLKNKRHLIRTIERAGISGSKQPLKANTFIVGLLPSDEQLRASINKRADSIFRAGVVEETRRLVELYGEKAINVTGGIVYKICLQVLRSEINEQTATTLFKNADWQYAKRQKTWFIKNNDIVWFTDNKAATDYIKSRLNT